MKTYAVITPNGWTSAWLHFDPTSETGTIELNLECPINECSPILRIWREQGRCLISEEDAMHWVAARVCPAGRENIKEILESYGLDHYNVWTLSIANGGICVCDYDHYEEVN